MPKFEAWIDGAPNDAFMLTDNLDIFHYNGQNFHLLSRHFQADARDGPIGGVAWLAPNRAVINGPPQHRDLDQILVATSTPGSTRAATIELAEMDQITAVASYEPGVVMLGTKQGHLIRWTEPNNATLLGTLPEPRRVLTILRLDDGVLFGGDEGYFAQWHPRGESGVLCHELQPGIQIQYGSRHIRSAARADDNVLLLSFNEAGGDGGQHVVWLLRDRPRLEPEACSR